MQLEPVAEGETREFVIQQEIRIFPNPRRAAADGRRQSVTKAFQSDIVSLLQIG
jgi:hypothetical protein